MGPYSTLETITIAGIAVLVVLWFSPGIKASLARNRQTEARWGDVMLPLGLVVLFVVFLITIS